MAKPPAEVTYTIPESGERRPGATPGTLVYTGKQRTVPVGISYFDYDGDAFVEKPIQSIDECFPLFRTTSKTWVNVYGLHDVSLVRQVAEHIQLHPLAVEDVLNTSQRPKVEEFPNGLYIVLRMLSVDSETGSILNEQVSFVLGPNYVFTFQEQRGDVFEPVRQRIRSGRGVIRGRESDYLAYALMDAVVDRYFEVLEHVGNQIEALESTVMEDLGTSVLEQIRGLRREVLSVRKAVWPLREALGSLYRGESEFIRDDTRIFLRDVHDHAFQVIDSVETLRELIAGVMDLHISVVSNRMNEVMKVLTIIATIFIPLSFLTGLYGMNFDVMPELHIPWGYPALLLLMTTAGLGMVAYFRRRGWI